MKPIIQQRADTVTLKPRAGLDYIRNRPELASLPLGASTVLAVLEAQPTFAVERQGSDRAIRLVPETLAGADLLRGAAGTRLHRMLAGAIGSLDARAGAATVIGFSLSRSPEGFAANRLLREHEHVYNLEDLPGDERRAYAADYLANATKAAQDGTGAASIDGRVPKTNSYELGHETSAAFERMAAGEDPTSADAQWAVQILAHELEHAVTPHDFNRKPLPKLEWLEEGIATVVAGSPLGHQRVAAAMGLPAKWSPDFLRDTHSAATRTMLDVLQLAGLDTLIADDFRAAEEMLQGAPLERVPLRLAKSVARQQGIPESRLPDLALRITDLQGDPNRLQGLTDWLRKNNSQG